MSKYDIDENLIPMIAEANHTKGAMVEIILNLKTDHVHRIMERTPEDFWPGIPGEEWVIGHDRGEKTIEELDKHVDAVVTIARELLAQDGILV